MDGMVRIGTFRSSDAFASCIRARGKKCYLENERTENLFPMIMYDGNLFLLQLLSTKIFI